MRQDIYLKKRKKNYLYLVNPVRKMEIPIQ
jgi:hypothetical protein